MKIKDLKITKVAVPFKEPEFFSTGKRYGVNNLLIEILTDEGITGIGESIGRPSPEVVESAMLSMKPMLLNRDPQHLEAIIADVRHSGGWHYFPRVGNIAFAGIEMALWDIKGKACHQPLYNLLGGLVRAEIPMMFYLFRFEIDEMMEKSQRAVSEGFKTIYFKVGQNVQEDIEAIKSVRKAVGNDIAIRIDVNEAWSAGAAVRIIKDLEEFRLEWVEQPTPSYDLDGLARVRKAVKTPIAADQACWTMHDVYSVLRYEAADVIVLDQYKAGGLWEYKKAATVADAAGIPINHHAWGELGVGLFAAAHVMASTPNFLYGNQSYILNLREDIIEGGIPKIHHGCLHISETPGIGVKLDSYRVKEAAKRYQLDGGFPPRIPFDKNVITIPNL